MLFLYISKQNITKRTAGQTNELIPPTLTSALLASSLLLTIGRGATLRL